MTAPKLWCPKCQKKQVTAIFEYDAEMICEVVWSSEYGYDIEIETLTEQSSSDETYSCVTCSSTLEEVKNNG